MMRSKRHMVAELTVHVKMPIAAKVSTVFALWSGCAPSQQPGSTSILPALISFAFGPSHAREFSATCYSFVTGRLMFYSGTAHTAPNQSLSNSTMARITNSFNFDTRSYYLNSRRLRRLLIMVYIFMKHRGTECTRDSCLGNVRKKEDILE